MKKYNKILLVILGVFIIGGLVFYASKSNLFQGLIKNIKRTEPILTIRQYPDKFIFENRDKRTLQVFSIPSDQDLINLIDNNNYSSLSSIKSDIDHLLEKLEKENQDLDGDGLTFSEEEDYGTDPDNKDTDDDGLLDGYEVDNLLNPINPDSDYDGVNDGFEIKFGTDPNDSYSVFDPYDKEPDLDGDTLTDNFEMSQNFAPYLDKNVPEDIVLYSGEGKKGVHKFQYDNKSYSVKYEFSNCSAQNSFLILNFPDTGWGLSVIECMLKNDEFVCKDNSHPDFFKPVLEGYKGSGYHVVAINSEGPFGEYCFGEKILFK